MRLHNANGEAVYYNSIKKHGEIRFIIKAASGQNLMGRDKQACKSHSFTNEANAERYLKRHGYTMF